MKKNNYTSNKIFKTLTVLLALVSSNLLIAQNLQYEWASQIGGSSEERLNSIAADAAGNIYTAGRFFGKTDFDPGANIYNLTSTGPVDIFISKLDASGNFLWAKSFGGPNGESITSFGLDETGNIYVTGTFSGTVDFDPGTAVSNLTADNGNDAFILKLNPSGDYVWAKRFGSLRSSNSLGLDAAGNVYTSGLFSDTVDFDPGAGISNLIGNGNRTDIFISKLDTDGNFVWARSFGNSYNEQEPIISIDRNGNVYTSAKFGGTIDFDPGIGTSNLTSLSDDEDIFVLKLDTDGNFVWAKSIGTLDNSIDAYHIDNDAAGNILITGSFAGTIDFDPGAEISNLTSDRNDGYVLKLDASGDFVWAKTLTGPSIQYVNHIHTDAANNIYAAASFYDTITLDVSGVETILASNGAEDILFFKMDSDGNYIWAMSFGSSSREYGMAITADEAGNVYAAGEFKATVDFDPSNGINNLTPKGGTDIFIMKLSCAVDISTSTAGLTITANATGATYQWVDCNNDNAPIAGETNVSYTATSSGDYAVIVTSGECSNISECINIASTANTRNDLVVSEHKLFPNPTTSQVTISNYKTSISNITILDITGKTLQSFAPTSAVIDMSSLPKGIYFVQLQDGETISTQKVIKH